MGLLISRYDFTDDTGKLLNAHATERVARLHIGRWALQKPLMCCLYACTPTNQEELDALYHVYFMVELACGNRFVLEKNSTVVFRRADDDGDTHEDDKWRDPRFTDDIREVALPGGGGTESVTLGALLHRTRQTVGDRKFFRYSAHTANCQDFVVDVLASNGLLTNELYAFAKQQTRSVLGGGANAPLRATVDALTTTDAVVRDAVELMNGV